jgi:hypothetical protein
MLHVLKRVAPIAARHLLFAGAVALLVADWSGAARADQPDTPEIGLGAVGGAMTLLAGGLLLLREGLRSRTPVE